MLLEPITCAVKLIQILIASGKNNCLDGFLNIHTTTKNTEYNAVTYTKVTIQQKCIS